MALYLVVAVSGYHALGEPADKAPRPPPDPPVRCSWSVLLGILGVHNAGNTAFWMGVPLVYCTTHLEDVSVIRHF
eukprot:129358-Pyramimonas_sp.AAC.1